MNRGAGSQPARASQARSPASEARLTQAKACATQAKAWLKPVLGGAWRRPTIVPSECHSDLRGRPLDIPLTLFVLLGGFQVLQHQRRFNRQARQLVQIRPVIDLAAAGNHLLKMHIQLHDPCQILGMARNNPRTELAEAIGDYFAVTIKALRLVDDVADIQVHAEGGPVDRANQLQV